jgi:hypothetical protein
MTHLQELLLDLGKVGGAMSLYENRAGLLHLLEHPEPGSERVGFYLVMLHAELGAFLRHSGLLPPISDERIVEIRDAMLPSQGEPFDCIAFARAILKGAHESHD